MTNEIGVDEDFGHGSGVERLEAVRAGSNFDNVEIVKQSKTLPPFR